MVEFYPPIEAYDQGLLAVGDGNVIYWETCGNPDYYSHAGWLEENAVIRDAPLLASIPGVLIHGRLDLSCPVDTAWELARAWPGAELLIDDRSGHRRSDTKRGWALSTLDEFARG
jgi:proline iminopeptidase